MTFQVGCVLAELGGVLQEKKEEENGFKKELLARARVTRLGENSPIV
jgi:hypothetical protein